MLQGLPAPLIDIPETETVSAGRVISVLERYISPGPWQRVSCYYRIDDTHRARDFEGPGGEVWVACELLVGTVHGYKIRLAVFPKGQQTLFWPQCCKAAEG